MSSPQRPTCTSSSSQAFNFSWTQESVGESDPVLSRSGSNELSDSVLDLSYLEFENAENCYLEELAFLHKEHMQLVSEGLICGSQFWPNTIDEVYNKNMYGISCFYFGDYPFDKWEEDYECYLYMLACRAKTDEELDFQLCSEEAFDVFQE